MIMRSPRYAICELETQESQWCESQSESEGLRSEEEMGVPAQTEQTRAPPRPVLLRLSGRNG